MKRVLTVLFCISLFVSGLSAQNYPSLPDQVEVFYPKVLQSITVKESDVTALMADKSFGQRTAVSNKKHWTAFSDRSNNLLYTAPGASNPTCGSLDFNEEVRIAKIDRGFALVYVEDEPNIAFPRISNRAKTAKRGWISLKNLLLWHTCPTNEYGIYNKALLCVNLDQLGTKNFELGKLYTNPTNKTSFETLTSEMDFYFIMKREGSMVLLAWSHTLDGGTSDKVLRGWVSEKTYVAWNQRTCVEPTWEKKDVQSIAGKRFVVYGEQNLKTPAVEYEFNTEAKAREPYIYRMNPAMYRFPILSTIDDPKKGLIYKCSSFATPDGDGPIDMQVMEDTPDVGKYTSKMLQDMTNIDIAIVIDGTKSMEPYFPAVKQAIKDAEKYFEADKFKIRVGLVIYRDYSDGEKGAVEYLPFTNSKNPKLAEWLDSGGTYGVRSNRSDRTLEEALYLGIDTALEKLNFNKDHSNLLFVVGDCGNDAKDTRFSRDALVGKLADKQVNIIGFQVRNGGEEAYSTFNSQLRRLMRDAVTQKYNALKEGVAVDWEQTKDGVVLSNSENSRIYVGAHNQPAKGKVMDASKLTDLIGDAVLYCKTSISNNMDIISQMGSPGFKPGAKVEALTLNEAYFKMKAGDDYDELRKNQGLHAFVGYTQKNINGIDYCKSVVFMSSEELQKLLTDLAPVANAASDPNNREPYVNAIKALVRGIAGHDDKTISEMSYKDVMMMATGLNESTDALNVSISDITDIRKVDKTMYTQLVSSFRTKYRKLQDIKSKPYQFTKTLNNVKYYWLPIDYLP